MRTTLTLALLAALAAPAPGRAAEARVHTTNGAQSAAERAERERERAAEQTERDRERAEAERERRQEQAERERERAQDQAERDRERAQAQAERNRERAAEQAERNRQRAEAQRERNARQGSGQSERTTRTLKIGASGSIDVSNVAGDITITRGGGSDAVIEIVKTARARSDAEAKEQLGLVQVDITERGSRVEIRTRYPQGDGMRRGNRRNFNVDVDINITAPAGTSVRAHSISGSIISKDIKGEVAFETVSGAINVANSGPVAAAKSISGDVEVVGSAGDGTLEASTASGSIVLRRVKARALEVNSISGSVLLEDAQCSRAEAQTISGDVQLHGSLAKGGRYELSSHSGSVELALSGNTGFDLEATSFSGSVRSDFTFTNKASTTRGGHALRGVFGDGSAILELTTFSGSIVVGKGQGK